MKLSSSQCVWGTLTLPFKEWVSQHQTELKKNRWLTIRMFEVFSFTDNCAFIWKEETRSYIVYLVSTEPCSGCPWSPVLNARVPAPWASPPRLLLPGAQALRSLPRPQIRAPLRPGPQPWPWARGVAAVRGGARGACGLICALLGGGGDARTSMATVPGSDALCRALRDEPSDHVMPPWVGSGFSRPEKRRCTLQATVLWTAAAGHPAGLGVRMLEPAELTALWWGRP